MTDSPITTELFDDLQTEVHVWYCDPMVIQGESKLSVYESVLSGQEFDQYQRFQFDRDKHSYLVSHALLRFSLSRYVDLHPSQWEFSRNEHGKPELVSQPFKQAIRFNLTHTEGLSACVIALDKACGIDAENICRRHNLEAVAKRMFAEEELQRLDASNIEQQFFYYWTLREAYVKALGAVLAGSSKEFYFDVDMKKMTADVHLRNGQQSDGKCWCFSLYEPSRDHVLSVAVESHCAIQVRITELIP